MIRRFFLDTNILVYSFSNHSPRRRERARRLVSTALVSQHGVISWQVVQEFLNVAGRKFTPRLSNAEAKRYLDDVLMPLCAIWPSRSLYRDALDVTERWRFSWYDALIVAAARQSHCDTLYTEDLQHLQDLDGSRVVNPFAPDAPLPDLDS